MCEMKKRKKGDLITSYPLPVYTLQSLHMKQATKANGGEEISCSGVIEI